MIIGTAGYIDHSKNCRVRPAHRSIDWCVGRTLHSIPIAALAGTKP